MNGQIDWQAQQMSHASGLQLGWAKLVRGLRNSLNMVTALISSRKKESRKEAADIPPSEAGNDVVNLTNIGTVLRATLERLLRNEEEHVSAFPSATMPS